MKLHQRGHLRVNNGYYIATTTAIATIGSAEWLEFLAHDRGATVTPVAALRMNRCLVNKRRHVESSFRA
jgi:hypothetical protein